MSSPPLLIERRAQQSFSLTTTAAHRDHLGFELDSLLHEAGLKSSYEGLLYSAAGVDPAHLISEVVTILGAAGGLGGVAAVLKVFFGRHKGITVKFGEDGEVLETGGLSVDDIIRLLDKTSPKTPPDLVIRDARDTLRSEEPTPNYIVPGGDFERAMIEAQERSLEGTPQEVVEYAGGRPRIIRRYEDGREVPRRPGCPPWCDTNHYEPHEVPVSHSGTIGTVTRPGGAQVEVGIVGMSGNTAGRVMVKFSEWALPAPPGRPQPPPGEHRAIAPVHLMFLSKEDAITLARLADLFEHADFAGHLREATDIIRRATRRRGTKARGGQADLPKGKQDRLSPAQGR